VPHPTARHDRPLLAALAAALALVACTDPRVSVTEPAPSEGTADAAAVAAAAHPITGEAGDYDPLMPLAANARVVLLGEGTHGTHEFYAERARITQRLIEEHGFDAVVVEGDWPEAARVNRWVRGVGADQSAEQALSSFEEFPRWMWRNEAVRDLVQWMRAHNDRQGPTTDVGFYGLDVYGMFEAADAVIAYLERVDPAAASRARERYACFEPHRPEEQGYGAASVTGRSCEAPAAAMLAELRQRFATRATDPVEAEEQFAVLGHAQSVVDAEAYFSGMYEGRESTWNLRDRRMMGVVDAVVEHLTATTGQPARVVVWAHNSHVGDARATQMGAAGEITLGQLARERHGAAAVLVGELTHDGTVLAATTWGSPGRVFDVRPALPGSYAALFHATGVPNFLLVLRDAPSLTSVLDTPRLERAIGVQYLPQSERQSHYFTARLASQFDAVLFFDTTRAVRPLP
jgi:erythromycin esterase-like protein